VIHNTSQQKQLVVGSVPLRNIHWTPAEVTAFLRQPQQRAGMLKILWLARKTLVTMSTSVQVM
jgi:hypothetical protein